tara:strand:+ start:201 stop:488 length:288 start_codon:yes stop_codon:yes gene_type:complete
LQESAKPKINGDATPAITEVFLTLEQAGLFKQLLTVSNETEVNYKQAEAAMADIQRQIYIALIAAGIPGDEVVGGNLDGDKPYFTVKNANGIVKE